MTTYAYWRPRSLEELWPLMEDNPGALLVAGGTDLLVRIRQRTLRPPALISLRGIEALCGIQIQADGRVRIGAATPVAELVRHEELGRLFPLLVQAASCLGSVQIRNAATIGGNLCNASPCADTAPPLMVLQARVSLLGRADRRELPIEQLFCGPGQTGLQPGELLEAIWLDPPRPGARGLFLKKRRVAMDLALASLAVLLELDGPDGGGGAPPTCRRVRLAAGSVAPVPLRLHEVERLIEGRALTPPLLAEARDLACRTISPITDLRATEEYRRHIIGVYLERALSELARGRPS